MSKIWKKSRCIERLYSLGYHFFGQVFVPPLLNVGHAYRFQAILELHRNALSFASHASMQGKEQGKSRHPMKRIGGLPLLKTPNRDSTILEEVFQQVWGGRQLFKLAINIPP